MDQQDKIIALLEKLLEVSEINAKANILKMEGIGRLYGKQYAEDLVMRLNEVLDDE